MPISKEEKLERLRQMPPQAQEIFLSEERTDHFWGIIERYHLNDTQRAFLSEHISNVILGFQTFGEFKTDSQNQLGLEQSQLNSLLQEILKNLVTPVLEAAGKNTEVPTSKPTQSISSQETPKVEIPTGTQVQTSSVSLTEQVAQFQARKKAREEEAKKQVIKPPSSSPPPANLPTDPSQHSLAVSQIKSPQPSVPVFTKPLTSSTTIPQTSPKPTSPPSPQFQPQQTKPLTETTPPSAKPDPYREPLT